MRQDASGDLPGALAGDAGGNDRVCNRDFVAIGCALSNKALQRLRADNSKVWKFRVRRPG